MLNFFKSVLRIIRSTVLSLVLICLVIFMVSNRDNITIHFSPLPFEIETKVFMLMICFFLFGLLFGFLVFSQNLISRVITGLKDKAKIKKLEKKVAKS